MSTTELLLKTHFEGRVLRTLQSYFRRNNDVLLKESLIATGLEKEDVEHVMAMIYDKHTVSEIMVVLRERNAFARDQQAE
ncbi:hypothetical protein E1B06_21365 [Brevibacillus laterosporus]|uniref:hypothetical protein n=1 Tax=Brevibacillus TaxID=55080 RepID=UPI0002404601|nr:MULTISPECIES: hypothetical protein [Brevibacillus]MBA4534220.1 hypothetical protein [Brevibacillus halotolerans]MCR8965857.1 hypothetical protein [Brevibacillus laterosporus]MCZ0838012.1 hypothetical protein [Brevibacillus halotolerans]MDF9414190.1 hypothetical protein [Brevibacillus laterosporus]CCF13171.1 putative uncharacterized protein [Brevibacillus laterosporus GI-9]